MNTDTPPQSPRARRRRSRGCCSSPMPPSPTSTSCHPRSARSSTQLPRSTSSPRPCPDGWPGSPTTSTGSGISPTSASTPCWATCTRSMRTPAVGPARGSVLTPIADAVARVPARPHPARAAQPRARQLAGEAADRAHRGALRPAADHLRRRPAGTHRAPPARCCSATTDRGRQSTPSSAQANCSRAGDALVVTVCRPIAAWAPLPCWARPAAWSTSSRSNVRPPRRDGHVADEGVRIAQERDWTPSRSRSGPPARSGRRSLGSPTATTRRRSSWALAD